MSTKGQRKLPIEPEFVPEEPVKIRTRFSPRTLSVAWLLLTLGGVAYLFHGDIEGAADRVGEVSRHLAQHVADRTLTAETTIEGFAAFVASHETLDHDEARDYARRLLARYPFLYMLEIVHRVPHAQRQATERELRRRYSGFQIRTFGYASDRQWRRAPDRLVYYPIVFQEPMLPDANVLGLDINSNRNLRQAMLYSIVERVPIATVPFELAEGATGYVLHRALDTLYRTEPIDTETALGGGEFALLALKADHLFSALSAAPPRMAITLHHGDFAADDARGQLFVRPPQSPGNKLEQWLFPRLTQVSRIDSVSQPFTLQVGFQPSFADLNIGGAAVILVFSTLLFLVGRLSMHGYFQREIQTLERQVRLFDQANFDTLTGLATRARVIEQLETAVLRARQCDHSVGVLFVDVDGFKEVNDGYGHAVGDTVLIEIAHRLSKHLRDDDTLGRYGGDEFLFVCSRVQNSEGLRFLIRRLKREFEQPISTADGTFDVRIAVGIATYPADGRNAQALIEAADQAMYLDKNGARKGAV